MDITERILKLVSLGWDGKEPELEFLQRVYGIKTTISSEGGVNTVVITFKNMGGYSEHSIRLEKKNIDPVIYCLRLFRTKNGEVIGPTSSFFISEDQEWT
jgi:hypothetical protein